MLIKEQYKKYKQWQWVVWNQKTDYHLNFFTRLKYAIRGFSINEYYWYNLCQNDYKNYISDYERISSREINGKYKLVLDDRLLFEEIVGKYVKVPENYAWVNNGIIYSLHGNNVNRNNILQFLKSKGKAVLKWNSGGGGAGTYVIEANGVEWLINGCRSSGEEVEELFLRDGDAILCEFMGQSSFSASLYQETVNTIRMVYAKKKGEEKATLLAAVQRVGCYESIPVDNLSQGGFVLPIDLQSGELGFAIAKLGKMENRLIKFESHPDNGSVLKGRFIPNWNAVVTKMNNVTNALPYLNFVAWDVLLTDSGICVIEGNASSGMALFQLEHGMKDSEFGELYKSYNIIS